MSGDGGSPSNIARGPLFAAMDAELNHQENGRFVRRAEIRNALANPENDYVDLLKSMFNAPEAIIDYVALHLYNRDTRAPQVWWKDKQPIVPILRQSIIEAIDLAEDLPIYTYWVCVGRRNIHPNNYPLGLYRPDEYPFEVLMSRTAHQFTRIVFTPPVPEHTRPETYRHPSNLWVVKRAEDIHPPGDIRIVEDMAIIQLYAQYEEERYGGPRPPYPKR